MCPLVVGSKRSWRRKSASDPGGLPYTSSQEHAPTPGGSTELRPRDQRRETWKVSGETESRSFSVVAAVTRDAVISQGLRPSAVRSAASSPVPPFSFASFELPPGTRPDSS